MNFTRKYHQPIIYKTLPQVNETNFLSIKYDSDYAGPRVHATYRNNVLKMKSTEKTKWQFMGL